MIILADAAITGVVVGSTAAGVGGATAVGATATAVAEGTAVVSAVNAAGGSMIGGGLFGWGIKALLAATAPVILIAGAAVAVGGEDIEPYSNNNFDFNGNKNFFEMAGEEISGFEL